MTKWDGHAEWPERIFELLIFLYPASFRERFGSEVFAVVTESFQNGSDCAGHRLLLWSRVLTDVLLSVVRAHAASFSSGLTVTLSRNFFVPFFLIGFHAAMW